MNYSEPISRHTPGPILTDKYGNPQTKCGENLLLSGVSMPCGNHPKADEAKANTALLVEAINTATETGLTPRQLAEVNRELVEALEKLTHMVMNIDGEHISWPSNSDSAIETAKSILARAKGAK
jgi:hypothetical protein